MFFVINKEKIKSYLISVSTVIILLVVSVALQKNIINGTVETGASITKMPINKIDIKEKEVAISINCIENMDNINNILDTLSKTKSKATFFVTGEIVDKYPEEIKKIKNNGNEIGSLSNTYTSLKKMTNEEVLKQIQECNKKIENLTNEEPTLFRTPYGEYNNSIIETIQNENMEVIGWNIDSLDSNGLTDEKIWEQIEENLTEGSIILMHNEYIGNSLENIITNIQKRGYRVNAVSDIMHKNNYQVDNYRNTETR